MRNSNLKSFTIISLFGDRDVFIPFESDTKILIGENGLGKTTVLNILYYLLTGKFIKLRDYDFELLELCFLDGEKISIKKESLAEFDESLDNMPPHFVERLFRDLGPQDISELTKIISSDASHHKIIDYLDNRRYLRENWHRYPMSIVINAVKIICGLGENNQYIKVAKKLLENEVSDTEILYFPTFRRIEEDLINLGLDSDKNKINPGDTRLIQFGMRDVRDRFEELKSDINSLSSKGLSQISTEILSQLVKGVPNINSTALQNTTKKDIDIILARVGDAISQEDKDKITSIVAEKRLKDIDDKYLFYFLQKLITIYEQQRGIDSDIESFVSVCNKYLAYSGKEIQYIASEVEFYLLSKGKPRIELTKLLSKLSSGEKQIISLFSRIYLSKSKRFIVLFDEPELSLSIFWQKLLLPDIVQSNKCKFLLSVTHSPFIFDNELELYAVSLGDYIKTSLIDGN